MKLIVLNDVGQPSLTLNTREWRARALLGCAVGTLLVMGALLFHLVNDSLKLSSQADLMKAWHSQIEKDAADLQVTREQVEMELAGLTAKVATLQARIMRLDALGEQMAEVADLDHGEFDFSQPPAVGGPELQVDAAEQGLNTPALAGELGQLLDQLDVLIKDREGQLAILDRQLAAREFKSQAFVAGRPIKRGWMSSAFGHRTDPFTGKKAWHNGVDFAGKSGSDVIAIASGVVTAAEKRYGYGLMVEINHGDGFVTRYAHNASNLVAIGDIVEKGGVVAKMGSTGRSTGPHVHFEVLRNGKAMNPEHYINRASL
ncbi:MAG: peptidoglycan DD-metalloendopeptidase family protein [Pseudomonadales bacterium]|nr:peptidoglycan DD-metalloendopeptidase family protein [Pseudomonadales bacterium]